jgi:putative IMPACT (imprinted ancient) family translation regulator
MLEVLLKQELTDVLAVVVRYYGGIKLGAGGLVRAYGSSVALALEHATFAHKQAFLQCTVDIAFDQIGRVENWLRSECTLLDTKYATGVTYRIELPESRWPDFQTVLSDRTRGQAEVRIVERTTRYVADDTPPHHER